ncbi:hypothetical protein H4Q26_001396 [Puccinia striiformis f. sp. tritici PST-130]|nr:hypothetical protein H4Q26_001396 [Puccinia striiformis f. sp. tritici PST-130]
MDDYETMCCCNSIISTMCTQPDQDQKLILKDQIMRLVKELVILPERKDPENDYHSNSNSLFHSLKTKGIGE